MYYPGLLAYLVFLFVFSWGSQQPLEPFREECTLEGSVVRVGTGEPLQKARLTLQKVGRERELYRVQSDSSGRFVLSGVKPGRYRLWAERSGHIGQEYGQRGPNRPGTVLLLEPGQTLRDIVVRLLPAAIITGRVSDEQGEPVAGAMVEVMRQRYAREGRELVQVGADSSDDRGEYRVHGLAPGRYYVSATLAAGWAGSKATLQRKAEGEKEENYPLTFYPGTNDPSQAVPVEVRPGEEARAIDFTLIPARAVHIRGRVFNSITGQPGRGAVIMLYPRELSVRQIGISSPAYVNDSQGTFEIAGVTPGSYNLQALWSDGENQYVARMPLDVWAEDVDDVILVIAPGAGLSGRLRVERSSQTDLSNLYVTLQSRAGSVTVKGAKVEPDGSFVLPSVPQGDYWIKVLRMPEDWYLKSARLDGLDVLGSGMQVTPGPSARSLELVISPAGAYIDGVALNQEHQPVPGASVVLVPEQHRSDRTNSYGITTTDQYGHFSFRGIPPGEYILLAWEEIESGAYYDPDFLRRYENSALPVRLREAERVSVEVKSVPADETFW